MRIGYPLGFTQRWLTHPIPDGRKEGESAALWESFTGAALSAVYADDPHAAQDILEVIRATIALHGGAAKGLSTSHAIRAVVRSSVEQVLLQRRPEIGEGRLLSHHPEPTNRDDKKPPKT